MKRLKLFLLLLAFLPASCANNNDGIKTICPTGAPSICYYTEGDNENFVTQSNPAQVLAQFQRDEYDAIVIDATSGLNAIKTYEKSYAFARLLTSGNLYLISYKYTTPLTDNSEILAFGATEAIPNLSLKTYFKKFNITNDNVELVDGVAAVKARIKAKETRDVKDYFLVAEPILTSLKNDPDEAVKNIKYELKLNDEDNGIGAIPQAALFINRNSYENKKQKFTTYLDSLYEHMNDAVNEPTKVEKTMIKYGEVRCKTEFGFLPNIARIVQDNNGFAVCEPASTYGRTQLNAFLANLDLETYSEDYFIKI